MKGHADRTQRKGTRWLAKCKCGWQANETRPTRARAEIDYSDHRGYEARRSGYWAQERRHG